MTALTDRIASAIYFTINNSRFRLHIPNPPPLSPPKILRDVSRFFNQHSQNWSKYEEKKVRNPARIRNESAMNLRQTF